MILFGVCFAAFLFYAALVWGVTATQHGVVLRNPISRREVAWHDVERFDLLDRWPFTAELHRKNDPPIKIWGIGGRNRESQQHVDQLNALRPPT